MGFVIAIVGRPNVGKSALFNRIVGRRLAIVHDEPGVTRDRVAAEGEWRGRPFTLIDTGGIGLTAGEKSSDPLVRAVLRQVELAIEAADVIILVVDAIEGLVPLDHDVTTRLRRSAKPVVLTVNKADNPRIESQAGEFAELGFRTLIPVSAAHGLGIDNLMSAALASAPRAREGGTVRPPDPESGFETEGGGPASGAGEPLRLAVVGRPNVGKSSLVNALVRSERVIVSEIPGTTRDAVDVPFQVDSGGGLEEFVLIDTAGLRKPRRVDNSVEFFSVKRTEEAIKRCDIAVVVLDAEAGVTALDKKIAGKVLDEMKACIVVINKWDLVAPALRRAKRQEKLRVKGGSGPRHQTAPATLAEFGRAVQEELFFLDYAPVIFASAQSGLNLPRLLQAIRFVRAQWQQQVPTALLNRVLHDAVLQRQPPSKSGRRLKLFYATQAGQVPPTFLLFVNDPTLLTEQYSKHLTGELRRAFGFEGSPIRLAAKARPRAINPIRTH